VRFVTVVLTDDGCKVESQDSEIVIFNNELRRESEDESEIYRVNLAPENSHNARTRRSSVSVLLA
jgi:hypothetical protein